LDGFSVSFYSLETSLLAEELRFSLGVWLSLPFYGFLLIFGSLEEVGFLTKGGSLRGDGFPLLYGSL